MGFRFRKSIKIMPGVRINVSKNGISSISVGKRGATANFGKKGMRGTVGIPGTGLSYSSYTPYSNKPKGQRLMSNYSDDYDDYEYERPVGFLLGFGIFILPIIFAWFTLRQGHTTRARVISFAWLILVLFLSFPRNNEPTPAPVQTVPTQTAPATPAQNATPKQIDIAENAFTAYTKEAYPKMHAKYGDEGLRVFTAHDANAGFMVAGLPECDRVEYVSYSEQRSNYPTNLVSFVDCSNNRRFYVSQGKVLEVVKLNLSKP
ncbi:MAG: DUF4236 domain-containing protein [Moraxella sp.]|nr:DUF4236 domain-containing protein [Moraxella sp.]